MKSAFLRELDEIFDGVVDDHEVAKWGSPLTSRRNSLRFGSDGD
jgi:hypothetical protein